MRREPVLVTGGAGYIGSHVALALQAAGFPVVVLDDLSTGVREAVPGGMVLVEGDVGHRATVDRVLAEHRIASVVHLAASISVPESMRDPLRYYCNNSGASAVLIRACVEAGVGRFIFSSTAAVYGIPRTIPVAEDARTVPINPYGRSKLVTEWALRDTAAVYPFRYVALRYFNVAGADPQGRAGQSNRKDGHLITAACRAALGARDHIAVFGTDYETRDGTCLRDYIHVSDLAAAHVAALEDLEQGGGSNLFNCGYGRGFSVREVLATVAAEAGVRLDVREEARRPGDPPALVADVSRIRAASQWSPRYDDLGVIVRAALAWEEKRVREEKPARSAGSVS